MTPLPEPQSSLQPVLSMDLLNELIEDGFDVRLPACPHLPSRFQNYRRLPAMALREITAEALKVLERRQDLITDAVHQHNMSQARHRDPAQRLQHAATAAEYREQANQLAVKAYAMLHAVGQAQIL